MPAVSRIALSTSVVFAIVAASFGPVGVHASSAIEEPIAQSRPSSRSKRASRRSVRPSISPKVAPSWPAFESRQAMFLDRVRAAQATGAEIPDALTQYLVSELVVTGVFRTENGYGAFLLATPTGNTFFAQSGAPCYNGHLAQIAIENDGFAEDVRVIFLERSGPRGGERTVMKRVEGAPKPAPKVQEEKAPAAEEPG